VFLVYRWWALLPAIAPVAVTVCLHSMTDYVSPWHEESYEVYFDPLFVLFVAESIIMHAAFLSVGLLLRAVWESTRSRCRGGALHDSAWSSFTKQEPPGSPSGAKPPPSQP
jgi:hypothetical protein